MHYGIVQAAGGSIDVDSLLGQGAKFRINLPLVAARRGQDVPVGPTPRHARSSARSSLPRGTENLLLVDDEVGVRRSTSKLLSSLGYAVETAGSGEEALVILARLPIDLMVTDLAMPQMTGTELAGRIRQTRPHLPIVFMSGNMDSDQLRSEIAEGQAVFLQKPVTLATLASTVRRVLDAVAAEAKAEGIHDHASSQQ